MDVNCSMFRKSVNFRDIGGYQTIDGKHVRKRQIFRSGGFSRMNETEKNLVPLFDIQTIVDLRSHAEEILSPDCIYPGIHNIRISGVWDDNGNEVVYSEAGLSALKEQSGRRDITDIDYAYWYYLKMPFNNPGFRKIFDVLLKRETPLMFHCATGKDRTGIAAALILMALDVPEETIIHDYILSNEYMSEDIKNDLMKQKMFIKDNPGKEDYYRMRCGVSEKTIRDVLSAIHEKYKTNAEFLKTEYNLSQDKIYEIKAQYLE